MHRESFTPPNLSTTPHTPTFNQNGNPAGDPIGVWGAGINVHPAMAGQGNCDGLGQRENGVQMQYHAAYGVGQHQNQASMAMGPGYGIFTPAQAAGGGATATNTNPGQCYTIP